MHKIILASNSPRRIELLKRTGIPFRAVESGFVEDMSLKMSPPKLVKHLALGKALAVAKRYPGSIVIGADTFVSIGKRVLGKPKSAEEAIRMLKMLSGKTNIVHTGLAIINTKTGAKVTKYSPITVTFRKISDREIRRYVGTGEPMDRAGAYAIQGGASLFLRTLSGDYNALLGLPISIVLTELNKLGVRV